MRDMLKLALEPRFEVSTARNGLDGLRCLEAGSFDAILLDLNMPILDGRGFIRELRRRGLAVPVLICSGETDIAQVAAALEVRDYVAKPVRLEHLARKLSRMTASSRMCSG